MNRDTVVLLTELEVTRAHIAAPHVLAAWEARDAYYWRRVHLGFLVGAAVLTRGRATGCRLKRFSSWG